MAPRKRKRREGRTSKRRVVALDRTVEACALRRKGRTYEEIAAELGYTNGGAAYKAVARAMAAALDHAKEDADHLRQLEADRLDAAQAALWPAVLRGRLGAIDVFTKLSARRARLLGLDAPAKREITGKDGGPIAVTTWSDLVALAAEPTAEPAAEEEKKEYER